MINLPVTAGKDLLNGAQGIRGLVNQVHLDVLTCLAISRSTPGRLLVAAGGE